MPLISRLGAMTSKAWGQFKAAVQQVVSGYLYFWGGNTEGQFGNNEISGPNSSILLQISPDISVPATPDTAAGEDAILQVRGDGSIWSWGANDFGQIGDDSTVYRSLPIQIGTLTTWTKVSAGNKFVAAIKSDNTLWVWGSNTFGKLGIDSSTTDRRSSPVQVGTLTNWASISAGDNFTAAITTTGQLFTWGLANAGRSGNGTTINRSSPVQIGTLTNWSQVDTGAANCLAIKTDGTLWSWGLNSSGAVGDGTTTDRSSPVQIGTLTNWTQIFAGDEGSFAIKSDGTLWSWGSNTQGRLGLNDSTTNNRSSPTQIGTLTNWSLLPKGSGSHAAAITTNKTMYVWGENTDGQLGDGTTANRSSPVQLGASRTWLAARINKNNYSIFIDNSNNLYTVGTNASGQLGQNTTVKRSSPIIIGQQGYWGAILSNAYTNSTVITKVNNSLWAWGNNGSGNLGDSTVIEKSSPIQIGTLTNWKIANSGINATAAVKTDGTLWTWGLNDAGGLGDGTTINKSSPVQVGGNSNWRYAELQMQSSNSLYALNYTNSLFTCGDNSSGQLGSNTTINRSSPVQVTGTWLSISPGANSVIAIRDSTNLFAWGRNGDGELGDGSTENRSSPVQITGSWAQISAGYYNGYGIQTDGSLWGWGDNSYGQIGNSGTAKRSSPVQIGTLTNWATVSAGVIAAYATKTDGTLWGWGFNGAGQIGQGNYSANFSSPVQIGTLTTWSDLSGQNGYLIAATNNNNVLYGLGENGTGELAQNSTTLRQRSSPVQLGTNKWTEIQSTNSSSSLAIREDGSLWSWGNFGFGILGYGNPGSTPTSRSSPIQVGTLTDWSKIAAKGNSCLALKTDGTLWAWGRNDGGQIGNDTGLSRSSPVQIGTLTDWNKIAMWTHAMSIKNDGTLWVWGASANGRLGNNTATGNNKSSPIQLGSDTDWAEVAAGGSHSLAVKTTGTLWSWGANANGQLGQNSTIEYSSPVQVGTLTNWDYVFAGNNNSFAIKTDGSLWVMGFNSDGNLGDGTTIRRSSPVQIGTLTNWKELLAASNGTGAIKTDGTLWTWGYNLDGQSADNSIINRSSPVQVGSATDWLKIASGNAFTGSIKST